MERDKRIGLNIGSGLPWTAVPVIGLPIATWMTRKAGYSFWQVLPFRSVTIAGLKRTGIPVRFVEPAWNPTTFLAHFRGILGAEGMKTKLQDPLFFADPETCDDLFKEILEVFHPQPIYHELSKMQEGGWVEVYPGLRMNPERLEAIAQRMGVGKPYVVDFRHLRSFRMSRLTMWKALERLLPFTGLIHVQAVDGEEWQGFIAGNSTLLGSIIQFAAKEGYDGPFVVEYDPRATGLSGLLPWRLANKFQSPIHV